MGKLSRIDTAQSADRRVLVTGPSGAGRTTAIHALEDLGYEAIDNLPEILKVPGVGAIMIGEGDLSQQLGHPRQYDHPVVVEHKARVLAAAREAGVPVAHPHANAGNVEQAIAEGYRILFTTPTRSYAGLEKGRALLAASGKD